jgi:hypothetical protein
MRSTIEGVIMAIKYTIKAADGTIHSFKTLKDARASAIGWSNGGLRIINQVNTAAEKRSAADQKTATN